MAISQIGSFQFVTMNPPPQFPFPGMEFEARAGVNGYAAWKIGWAADRFQVVTFRDCVDLAAAQSEYTNYQTLVGAAPQTIHYAGMLLPFKVIVERVEADQVTSTALGVGGILGTSRGYVRAKWSLIPWVV